MTGDDVLLGCNERCGTTTKQELPAKGLGLSLIQDEESVFSAEVSLVYSEGGLVLAALLWVAARQALAGQSYRTVEFHDFDIATKTRPLEE